MGTWAAGLYDDDEALDLKDSLAIISKMPVSGEQMIQILQENCHSAYKLNEEGGPAFWLVVADQFAKKGIVCDRLFDTAKKIIEDDLDIKDKVSLGVDQAYVAARRKVLCKLYEKIRLPISAKKVKAKKTKPRQFVRAGEVYVYPTMQGYNATSFIFLNSGREENVFVPDGHGALLIVATGTVFDWFPWCAYSPLSVDPDKAVTVTEINEAKLTYRDGAAYCVAKPSCMRELKMERLCTLVLDPEKANDAVRKGWKNATYAVTNDLSFGGGAHSTRNKNIGFTPVRDLILRGG